MQMLETSLRHFGHRKFSFPLKSFWQHLAQSVSQHGNTVYELITEIEKTNQNVRNAISEVENVKIAQNRD